MYFSVINSPSYPHFSDSLEVDYLESQAVRTYISGDAAGFVHKQVLFQVEECNVRRASVALAFTRDLTAHVNKHVSPDCFDEEAERILVFGQHASRAVAGRFAYLDAPFVQRLQARFFH